jgi:hypothetical protein
VSKADRRLAATSPCAEALLDVAVFAAFLPAALLLGAAGFFAGRRAMMILLNRRSVPAASIRGEGGCRVR